MAKSINEIFQPECYAHAKVSCKTAGHRPRSINNFTQKPRTKNKNKQTRTLGKTYF